MANVNSQTGAINRLEKSYQKIKDEYDELRKKQSQNELVDEETINKLRNQIKQFANNFMSDVQKLDSVNENVYNRAIKIINNMKYLVDDLIEKNPRVDKNNQTDVALILETLIGYMEEDYNLIKSRNVDYEGLLEILLKDSKDCLTNYNAKKITDKDVIDLVKFVVEELKNSFNYDVSKKAEKQINSEKGQQNNTNHTNYSNNSQTNKGTNNRTNKTNNSNNNNKQKNDEIRKRYKVVNTRRSGLALGGIALGVWGARRVFNTISLMINWGADLVSIPQLGVTAFMLLSGGALLKKAFFYRDKKLIKMTMEKAKDKSENNNKKENKGRRGRR